MTHHALLRSASVAFVFTAFFGSSGCDSGTSPSGPPPSVDRYVATNGTDTGACTTQASPCRTIQYALDTGSSTTSDLVHVAAGNYPGNLTIDLRVAKFVSIRGAGNTSTTIVGTIRKVGSLGDLAVRELSMMPNATQAIAIDFTSTRGSRPSLSVSNVIISGYSANGILSDNANVTVTDSQILDSGADGIRIDASDDSNSVVAGASIRGTTVMRSGDDGIQINGLHGKVEVLQSLIDFSGGAGIQGERVGGGILELVIQHNCIRRSQTEAGIYLNSHSGPANLVTVANNNLTSNACGAHVTTSRTDRYSMTNNWWGTPGGPTTSSQCAGTNVIVGPIDFAPVLGAASTTTPTCPP